MTGAKLLCGDGIEIAGIAIAPDCIWLEEAEAAYGFTFIRTGDLALHELAALLFHG